MKMHNEDLFKIIETEGFGDEEILTKAVPPSSRDTAESWASITGNTASKDVLRAFVLSKGFGQHVLIYGPNRSGKTTMIHLALKAKLCKNRDPDLNPCNLCVNCRRWNEGAGNRFGHYRNMEGQDFKFLAIDGTNPATYAEDTVCLHRDNRCPLIVYIDEVSHPDFIKFMPRLIKPMEETPITIVASGVRLRSRKNPVTGVKTPGLSKDFVYRFWSIKRTSAAAKQESLIWLRQRAERFDLHPDDETLNLILDKACMIPGQSLRPLREAKLLKVPLSYRFVENFNWEVE